jgi:hypothetical protein
MQNILTQVGRKLAEVKKQIADKTLLSLLDVNPNPVNLGVLQYNSLTSQWTAEPPELIGAVIDGGVADTVHLEALDIDGGGA